MVQFLKFGIPLFLFIKWWFNDRNFWSTDFYIGKKGCGKTCTIAKLALKYTKKGFKVYTNVEGISNTYLFDPKNLDSFITGAATPIPTRVVNAWNI